jgi:hypothetical protein
MHGRRKTRHVKRSTKRSRSKRSRSKRSTKRTKRSTKRKHIKKIRGGNAPFIGSRYNAADAAPNGNYLAYNPKVVPLPEQSNAILNDRQLMGVVRAGGGGRKRSGYKRSGYKRSGRKSKKMRGGSLSLGAFATSILPDDVVNLGRAIPAGLGNMYNNYTGLSPLPSSYVYPTQQPVIPTVTQPTMSPPDILGIYNTANNQVSNM